MTKELFKLEFEDLGLEEVGDKNPSDRLLGTVEIGGVGFHVEFTAVKLDKRTHIYHAVEPALDETVEHVCAINDADFTPVEYNGREYCVCIVPFAS